MGQTVSSGIDWSSTSYEEVCRNHRWIIPERLNIGVLACDRHADGRGRTALFVDDEDGHTARYSFDQLKSFSDRFHAALREMGLERGDRIAVFLPQRVEAAIAHLAAFKLGAISVPLSPLFRHDALEYRLSHSGAKLIITDAAHASFLGSQRAPVISCDDSFWPIIEKERSTVLPAPVDSHANDPAMLIYTSGTSGMPKGALHAHRFLPGRLSGFELLHRLESVPSELTPFWTPADWAWVGGLVDCVLTPWIFGCPVLAHRRTRFDARSVFSLIARASVRSLFLPPTALNILRRVENARDEFALKVFSVHSAGEPLSRETFEWAQRTFGNVLELYGMTEMGATIGNSPFFPVRPGSMGKPYPGHRVALLDEHGDPVAQGEIGEISIQKNDPGMFLGYFDDPAGTAARFSGEYLRTGDLARCDADGYFWYHGRTDDMFNTAGYRVGPTEIEACLEAHPAVERAAVVGEPDEERGAVVKAFVLLRAGELPSEQLRQQLREQVKGGLAVYEYPRRIVFARELPLTTTGKLRRAELRRADADLIYGAGERT